MVTSNSHRVEKWCYSQEYPSLSRALISLILHASYVSYIFDARQVNQGALGQKFTRGLAARCRPPAGRSALGRPRHLTKTYRERTAGTQGIWKAAKVKFQEKISISLCKKLQNNQYTYGCKSVDQ